MSVVSAETTDAISAISLIASPVPVGSSTQVHSIFHFS